MNNTINKSGNFYILTNKYGQQRRCATLAQAMEYLVIFVADKDYSIV